VDTESAGGVAVSDGHAYVADGWSGLRVIDISDPTIHIIVGTADTVSEYTEHYHQERNCREIGNRLIDSGLVGSGKIQRHQGLGGLLNYYYRRAA
jgi:hypothetical protein